MVSMPAFWMCDLAPTEIAGSDALNRDQLLRRKVATPNRVNTVGRASSARRLLRVLVVDDVRDTADGLVRLVRRWGHDTRSAYDGVTGLKVAAAQQPDVVLLDIALPDMDGCQMAREIHRNAGQEACLIIAITGAADVQRRQRCMDAGIDLLLVKPVAASILETLLMLECERMNGSQALPETVVAGKDSPCGTPFTNIS
jgi:CheY-like chemotaxis protein